MKLTFVSPGSLSGSSRHYTTSDTSPLSLVSLNTHTSPLTGVLVEDSNKHCILHSPGCGDVARVEAITVEAPTVQHLRAPDQDGLHSPITGVAVDLVDAAACCSKGHCKPTGEEPGYVGLKWLNALQQAGDIARVVRPHCYVAVVFVNLSIANNFNICMRGRTFVQCGNIDIRYHVTMVTMFPGLNLIDC